MSHIKGTGTENVTSIYCWCGMNSVHVKVLDLALQGALTFTTLRMDNIDMKQNEFGPAHLDSLGDRGFFFPALH